MSLEASITILLQHIDARQVERAWRTKRSSRFCRKVLTLGIGGGEPVQDATKRDSSTTQTDCIAGAKREEKVSLVRSVP
jgi:hypothetical protein